MTESKDERYETLELEDGSEVRVEKDFVTTLLHAWASADAEEVSRDKEAYISGRIDSLREHLEDPAFARDVYDKAVEAGATAAD